MKYLKTYKEAVAVYQNHEHKSVIEDMLLELKDSEFHTTVSIQKFHNNHETVRVHVEKDKEFNWNDISQVISDVASYMELEDYNIVDFTCKDDVEFKENPDDFEVKKIVQAHYWGTDSSGEIKSELKDVLQIPHITQTSVYDAVTFNRINQWIFDIKFKKQLIEVDKTRGVSKITNEELSPSKYFRVADELKKMGHIRRPKNLINHAKHIILEEAKKLGQFQLKLERRGEIRFVNCYIQLYFNSDYYLSEMLPEWLDDERNSLWPQFMFGVHPVSEEDLEVLDWYVGGDIKGYTNSNNGIIWLQDVYINLTNQRCKDHHGVKLPMVSTGAVSIECSEFSEVYFSNRREAIKFRNLLVGLFEGDIDYIQPNGKDFKEDIIETWCDHEERPVELSELEDFIDKLRMTRLNSLYRD
jgi:hypothetical protein